MNLSTKIARLQLSSFPDVVVKRLLQNEDIVTLAEMGSAQVGGLGDFNFSDIREALSKREFGTAILVPRLKGGAINIVRLETGLHLASVLDSPQIELPEFALLDSDVGVRLNALSALSKRSKPCWPNCNHWLGVLTEQPLSNSEFGNVIDELQHVPERELAKIVETVGRGNFGVTDLIPSNRSYYESLIGTVATADAVGDYITHELMPHLEKVLSRDTAWGLRCVQATCISVKVNVVAVTRDITNDELISTILALEPDPTPFADLALYQIAQSRAASDIRFSSIADDALNRLLEQAMLEDTRVGHHELFPALVRLTLNAISQNEQLWMTPPYWRRLAAFSHASVLLSTLDFNRRDTMELAAWCDSQHSPVTALTGTLDFIREPAWRADILTEMDLDLAALIHAIQWSPDSDDHFLGLSQTHANQIQALTPKFRLAFGLPDPLFGGQRRQDQATDLTIGEELLQGFTDEASSTMPLNTHQIWNALTYSARIYVFRSELLEKVRSMAREILQMSTEISEEKYVQLSCAAELAALQGDEELAGILAPCILNVAEHITRPVDAAKCAAILVMASGANANWTSSLTWAAGHLVTLAYCVPRGACSEELAAWLETAQRFIPLTERQWGKAWIIARSAIR